jgi:sialate O-acetylesterase
MTNKLGSLFILIMYFAYAAVIAGQAAENVRLSKLFSDHAVLQRNKPVKIWGWCEPGREVTIKFAGQQAKSQADKNGKWLTVFKALPAGGPYTLTVSGKPSITRKDILMGDVWLCGGQSNMEWKVVHSNNGKEALSTASQYDKIRLFEVPRKFVRMDKPENKLPGGNWKICNRKNLTHFSAVGFYFGRELYKELNVPIGLISCNWGASTAEAWMSPEAVGNIESLRERVEKGGKLLGVTPEQLKQKKLNYNKSWNQLLKEFSRLRDVAKYSQTTYDATKWDTIPVPSWLQSTFKNFHGFVYYRKTIDIPENIVGKKLILDMGRIYDTEVCFFNGVEIGRSAPLSSFTNASKRKCRIYNIPGKLVKKGKNIILIAVASKAYSGGIIGNSKPRQIARDNFKILLSNNWKCKKAFTLASNPAMEDYFARNSPCALFFNMLAPLRGFALKGIIWYQGENNAGRAYQYRNIFPALIKDWRKQFEDKNLPFIFAQISVVGNKITQPHWASAWAELREAQAMALSLPRTGMAVTIDIGETSIHPRNKLDVGKRLSLYALSEVYGKKRPYSGPVFKSIKIDGNKAIISFDHVYSGLMCKNGELKGFAIAGKNKRYYWAKAEIKDDKVIVSSPEVLEPVSVRYAWATRPRGCNLYNKENLPAVPFRTDNFKPITFNVK